MTPRISKLGKLALKKGTFFNQKYVKIGNKTYILQRTKK